MSIGVTAITVGSTFADVEQLHSKLARHGVIVPPSGRFPLDSGSEGIESLSAPVDVFFYQCEGSLDRDCTAITRIRAATNSEIAAVGAIEDPHNVLRVIRAGASDFLHDSGTTFRVDLSSFLARIHSRNAGATGRKMTMLSVSGGCGATTTAVNLSTLLAEKNQRCALIELSLRGGDCGPLLDLTPQHSLFGLTASKLDVDASMIERSMVAHHSGVKLLGDQPGLAHVSPPDPDASSHLIELIARRSDYVLLDLQNPYDASQFRSARHSDMLLFIIRLELNCLMRTRQLLTFVESQGVDTSRIKLIANRQNRYSQISPLKAGEALGLPVIHCLPDDHRNASISANIGNPVVLERPAAPLSKSYRALMEKLIATPKSQ